MNLRRFKVTAERPDPEDTSAALTEVYVEWYEDEDEARLEALEQWPDAKVRVEACED